MALRQAINIHEQGGLPVIHLPGFSICCKPAGKLTEDHYSLDTLYSMVKWYRKTAQGSALPVGCPNQTGPIPSPEALAEFGQSCWPQFSVPSTSGAGGTATSCSGGISWDSLSQLPAVQCHHHLSPLVDSSGVSHAPSTGLTFSVLSSHLHKMKSLQITV